MAEILNPNYAKCSYIYCKLKINYTSNDQQNRFGLNVKILNRIVVWRLKEHALRRKWSSVCGIVGYWGMNESNTQASKGLVATGIALHSSSYEHYSTSRPPPPSAHRLKNKVIQNYHCK